MSNQVFINHAVRRKNRVYWSLQDPDVIPDEYTPVDKEFEIKGYLWHYFCSSFRSIYTTWLEMTFTCLSFRDGESVDQFNARVGIVDTSGKEIVASNAVAISDKEFVVNRLIKRSELLTIMQNDEDLRLFVEIKELDVETQEEKKYYRKKIRTDYRDIFLGGKDCDFTFKVKETEFPAHKLILGIRSPVFAAMVEHEMKEKQSSEVCIKDADPAIFKEFLLFLYTGDEEDLSWENVTELYKLGDKYCLDDLKSMCLERMKTNISIENFFEIFQISQQSNNSELFEVTIQFFVVYSKEITVSENWTAFQEKFSKESSIFVRALEENK